MAEYHADQFYALLAMGEHRTEAKMYVDIDGINVEIVGARLTLNGGSYIFILDKTAVHHVRERFGKYKNKISPPERRLE